MDELIDILDSDGHLTEQTEMKSVAHREGLFHQTVHIWFYTKTGDILLQQRGKNKATFPLLWDVSVAGHIGAGESIEISALREIEEEIGLQISKQELQKIGVFKSIHKHSKTLIDCEFHHTFITELKVPLHSLKKQESEVENLKLIAINQLKRELKGKEKNSYVPHKASYYEAILKKIKH
ncbi:NUDIX domain-containing protein [Maribacter vaceletii]|uniref:NUDIX domain-containing protein n=1 Tax=Maribacter vaceletii TaxID=1206816 RepID=A0A495EA82_9FLAO|nr:NUDIX domain-containing protein [Maribacter vaceletii]RKR13423.1 NUDIX domain-containing protein [Maribacter vaceletii]